MNARDWNTKADDRAARQSRAAEALGSRLAGKRVEAGAIGPLLEAVIAPCDRVCLEGNTRSRPTSWPRR